MNTEQQKFWATLVVFLIASAFGYGAWLICTAAFVLLAEVVLVLLRRCYICYYGVNLVRARRHCHTLCPFVALCVAVLFNHLYHKQIHPYVILFALAATVFYFVVLLVSRPDPRQFRVLNVLFLLTVNLVYGQFGFGLTTCLWVVSFTNIIAVLRAQAPPHRDRLAEVEAETEADAVDDLQHLITLDQIMSNLIIRIFYISVSETIMVLILWE
ncbi:hypothetical protein A4A49_09666 [Nicotiana attenuata]|uniref:Uncharacterized protein n=1 Tax=Nicotiana attenuata TaxID=49451 RepID=A0A314KRE8_NICAT|nr:hypothetical protein A4A49_09666 [Nicotiana attenuata]